MKNLISYCIFNNSNKQKRIGVKIGNIVVDLQQLAKANIIDANLESVIVSDYLNEFIAKGKTVTNKVREKLLELFERTGRIITPNKDVEAAILNITDVQLHMPIKVGGFTDFYASENHATNIGRIFRPENPLLPNWKHMPIAYNGRASSVTISKHPVIRPAGQILMNDAPIFSPTKKLDFEVEFGVVIGKNSTLGQPISIENAYDYVFGVCIVNDWSSRDIQQWEYQPLGPFNSKSFLTSISPSIVPLEELELVKVTSPDTQSPLPMKYLQDNELISYNIDLIVTLKTAKYPEGSEISTTNFKNAYWSIKQWIAHHTITGCSLSIGDILASGTLSGNETNQLGSMMEMSKNGKLPITLPNGETRNFLEDHDELIITAVAVDSDGCRYNIGEVSGVVSPNTYAESIKL